MSGGGGNEKLLRPGPHHQAVVEDGAIQMAHETVARPPLGNGADVVHVQLVQKPSGVGAAHVDFAERGGVHDGNAGARRAAFAPHGVAYRFAGAWVTSGAQPLPSGLEDCTECLVRGVDCGGTHGFVHRTFGPTA